MWVSATITSGFPSFAFPDLRYFTHSLADLTGSLNSKFSTYSALAREGVSGCARPIIPIFIPDFLIIIYGLAQDTGLFVFLSYILDARYLKLPSFAQPLIFSYPQSNSWFPTAEAKVFIPFIIAVTGLPKVRLESAVP